MSLVGVKFGYVRSVLYVDINCFMRHILLLLICNRTLVSLLSWSDI